MQVETKEIDLEITAKWRTYKQQQKKVSSVCDKSNHYKSLQLHVHTAALWGCHVSIMFCWVNQAYQIELVLNRCLTHKSCDIANNLEFFFRIVFLADAKSGKLS